MKPRLKILFLSQRFLFPMDTGGKIRTGKMLERLRDVAELTIVSNVESPRDDPYVPQMSRLCERFVQVPWKEPRRYSPGFWLALAARSLSRYPVSVLNDYSRPLERALLRELEQTPFDLAVCDFLQSTLVFRHVRSVPTVLFQHNVEATITQRHAEHARGYLAKLFWRLQHRKLLAYEAAMCRRFDATVAVSEADKHRMEEWYGARTVHAIPTGVDTEYFSPQQDAEETKQLVFTGSMDWLPNEDAILYFVERILPLVQQQEPETRLVVVGRRPTPALRRLVEGREDVVLTGWVEDTRPYIAASAVYVVPLRIGGGTRIKIYEAMSMGKPVISTSIGAEGLPVTDGVNALIADTEEHFASQTIALLRDGARRRRIGNSARQFVQEHFGWERAARAFLGICQDAVYNYRAVGRTTAAVRMSQSIRGIVQ